MRAKERGEGARLSGDRGQAFTLEGVLGAAFLVIALLIALQTTVITPTTGGDVDDGTREQLQQKANDILVITASQETKDLGWYVRLWNPNTRTFYCAERAEMGYGSSGLPRSIDCSELPIEEEIDLPLGEMLEETFTKSGRSYNLLLRYQGDESPEQIVYQGPPAEHAVVATYPVTLYDNQTLTPGSNSELWEYVQDPGEGAPYYPIPDANPDGPVYNVVEVRLVVW